MKNLLKYLKGYEKQCVLGPLFKLLEATFELLVPLVVARIVDQGISGGNTGYIVKSIILAMALIVVGYFIYKEQFTMNKAIGIAACMLGLYFINK